MLTQRRLPSPRLHGLARGPRAAREHGRRRGSGGGLLAREPDERSDRRTDGGAGR